MVILCTPCFFSYNKGEGGEGERTPENTRTTFVTWFDPMTRELSSSASHYATHVHEKKRTKFIKEKLYKTKWQN